MNEKSKIVPNTFQTPNVLTDEYMRYLTGDEIKCYLVVTRQTLGWLKQADRIATSQIAEKAGIGDKTVTVCMKSLCAFGLIIRKSENNPQENAGIEWALEMDSSKINRAAMQERAEKQAEKDKAWYASMQEKKAQKAPSTQEGGVLSRGGGGVLSRGPQKPIKAIEDNKGKTPEIFGIYQQNIGMLTPVISEMLIEAEKKYDKQWIVDAFTVAVTNNVRKWKYVEAVLDGWERNGRDWTPHKGNNSKGPAPSGDWKTL